MDIIYNEIITELKKEKNLNNERLKTLVLKRIQETEENKFNLCEIEKWSKYFNIQYTEFLINVLDISKEQYNKLIARKIRRVSSERYNKMKEKVMRQKAKKYLNTKNLNKRNYYNLERLIIDSSKLNINIIDFTCKILGKDRKSLNRVKKDNKNRNRLYIGRYVNTALPMKYIEKNQAYIYKIINIEINRFKRKFYLTERTIDRDELVQSSMIYLIDRGNDLDRRGNPVIKDSTIIKSHTLRMYKKIYFYIINNYKKQRNTYVLNENKELESNLIDQSYYSEIEELIKKCFTKESDIKILIDIFRKGYSSENIEKVAIQNNMSIESINNILGKCKNILLTNCERNI